MAKSIFTLSVQELRDIVEGNKLPEDITLEGIDSRKDFDKLFRMRNNPKGMASYLLKEQGETSSPKTTGYVPAIPLDMRQERLALKQAELEIKRAKLKKDTTVIAKIEEMAILLNGMNKRLGAMENILKRLVSLHLEKDK